MAAAKKKTTGKVRPAGDDPFEDVGFAIDDTYDLIDEVCEELGHIDKMVTGLKKRAEKLERENEALKKKRLRGKMR